MQPFQLHLHFVWTLKLRSWVISWIAMNWADMDVFFFWFGVKCFYSSVFTNVPFHLIVWPDNVQYIIIITICIPHCPFRFLTNSYLREEAPFNSHVVEQRVEWQVWKILLYKKIWKILLPTSLQVEFLLLFDQSFIWRQFINFLYIHFHIVLFC